MKAVLLRNFGDTSVLYLGEAPPPELQTGQIRIRVHASGINRADIHQREGNYPPPAGESEILGLEVAGVVAEVGEGQRQTQWKVGDRVMALLAGGGYAEEVCVDAELAMALPPTYSFVEGAATVEAYLTAFHNLFRLGALQQGQDCLIHAGASSVGLASLQLVRDWARYTFATVGSPAKAETCRTLGATAIEYRTQDFAAIVAKQTTGKGVEVILDPVGGSYLDKNLDSLAIGGRQVIIGLMGGRSAEVNLGKMLKKRVQLIASTLRGLPLHDKRTILREFGERFGERVQKGELRPIVDRIFPVAEVAAAHAHMQANANTGKIVLNWE